MLSRVAAVAEQERVSLGRVGLEARAADLAAVVTIAIVVVTGSALLACASLVCCPCSAGLARVLDVTVLADGAAPAIFALALSSSMLADGAAPAVSALTLPSSMLADAPSTALPALVPDTAVLADATPAAVLAPALLAVVRAEDVPTTVPAYLSTAARTSTAPTLVTVAGAPPAPAPAVHAHAAVLRQLVDEVLLLPGLRQSRVRAQLLQLRDGLRTCAHVHIGTRD
jgi:hypothetical protein